MKKRFIAVALLSYVLVSGCGRPNDKIYQFSTINALMEGCYQGQFEQGELSRRGDFGIGTFDGLEGEMIVLEGAVYQVRADGGIYRPGEKMIPFAVVTSFRADETIALKGNFKLADLHQQIDIRLPSSNIFYAIRVDGEFAHVRTRSVPVQQKPYPKLAEVVKAQPVFEKSAIQGTLVGFKCPEYIFPLNVPGYHLHFLSEERNFGGHLLECQVRDPVIQIDYIRQIALRLPPGGDFDEIYLGDSDRKSLNKAEK